MAQNGQPEGTITRQIREAQERYDKLIADRQKISDRVKQSTDQSQSTPTR